MQKYQINESLIRKRTEVGDVQFRQKKDWRELSMKQEQDPEVQTFDTLEVANKKLETTPNYVQWNKGPPVRKYLQFE